MSRDPQRTLRQKSIRNELASLAIARGYARFDPDVYWRRGAGAWAAVSIRREGSWCTPYIFACIDSVPGPALAKGVDYFNSHVSIVSGGLGWALYGMNYQDWERSNCELYDLRRPVERSEDRLRHLGLILDLADEACSFEGLRGLVASGRLRRCQVRPEVAEQLRLPCGGGFA